MDLAHEVKWPALSWKSLMSTQLNSTRGFHVYKDVWRPVIGKGLRCQREEYSEEDNPRNPYAVAVTKSRTGVVEVEVVGHIPRYFINSLFIVYKAKWCSLLYSYWNPPILEKFATRIQ